MFLNFFTISGRPTILVFYIPTYSNIPAGIPRNWGKNPGFRPIGLYGFLVDGWRSVECRSVSNNFGRREDYCVQKRNTHFCFLAQVLEKNTNYFYAVRISILLAILSEIFNQIRILQENKWVCFSEHRTEPIKRRPPLKRQTVTHQWIFTGVVQSCEQTSVVELRSMLMTASLDVVFISRLV